MYPYTRFSCAFPALCLAVIVIASQQVSALENSPVGYASLAGDPCVPATYLPGGTTGGAGGTLVTVTTAAQFGTYARKDTPYIIQVQGDIGYVGQINMHSNKTIIGIGPNPTIRGNLVVSGASNFIIRNLIIRNDSGGSSADGIAVRDGGHHVWVDHCDIFNVPDGECDITKEADYVTVSWCRFYYTPDWSNEHRYACLMGASDDDTSDLGRLHVTWHHNWWGDRVIERMPSVRYGRVHIYNNYYTAAGNNYCIRYRVASQVIVENNYFQNVRDPHVLYVSGDEPSGYPQGLCYAFGNIYDNISGTYNSTGPLTMPPYSWTADNTADVPAIVIAGAGVNKLSGGDITPPSPNPMTFATAPYAISSSAITMEATTATDDNSVEYYFRCTTAGGHDSGWQTGTIYTDTGLLPSTAYTYQVKARDLSPYLNETAYSSPASATTQAYVDTEPPTPNPMTFATLPYGHSTSSISMVATTATDNANGVEYYFANMTLSGHDSGWQSSSRYTDTGLALGTSYTYRVKARDTSGALNETEWSDEASGSTLSEEDTTPPAPDPMSFAVAPHAVSPTRIAMTASEASDASGVQYYFACLTPGGHDSGWQDSTSYTDFGLQPLTSYSYRVKARDMSAACNETSWSGPASAATPAPLPVFENSPIGWASYNDLGNNGTTGGAGGSTVDVYDQAALKAAIAQSGPLIIRVHGSIPITGSSGYDIASDKTLTGVGDDATIVGGLRILDKHNIIIRNITFRDNSINDKDGLTIQGTGTHHVWIDHCNIANNADGGIDITHGVDYVTVSWCHFYNQSKVSLVGHSDSNASEDSGHFKVTFHHNWFDATDERHPRVRFSFLTHVFNNYYVAHPSWTENYAVASTCGGYVLVEGCYFQDYIKQYVYSASGYMSSPAGYLCALGNVSVNCISNGLETNCPSDPPSPGTYYAYTLDNAADVPSIVTAGAGAGRLVDDTSAPLPDPMTWEVAPTGITMSSITMVATAASDDSGVEYYFHCLSGGGHDSGWQDSTTYTDTDLVAATTYTYQVKARDKSSNHNETAYSAPASAVTQIYNDTTPPTPDPMAWASVPSAVAGTCDSITMTAATATDLSGVEYYFSNVTDVAHDSGWQDSPVYVDTGLANNTLYTYTVKARDKSINHNATRESVTASAVTLQYVCTGAIAGDLDGDCRCNFADFAPLAEALGTWVPFENLLVNGTFATDIDPWLLTTIGTVYGTVTVDWDGTGGNPPGAAIMNADTTVSGSSQTNNRRFYQVFSVTEGKKYIFSGQWKGDIRGLVTNPTGGTLRNWAEVMINFESGADPCTWSDWTNSSAIKYKKAYGAGTTNTSTGIWDWEEITASKNSGGSPPADDIYTVPAGKSYMVVAFNLGGRANSGTTWISMDNMSVIEHACPAMDLNGDCNLDCTDLAQFAQDWLTCYREPASECWN